MKRILALIIFCLGSVTGCIDPISVDPGQANTLLVVEGLVLYNPDDPSHAIKDTVKLSYTQPYLDNGSAKYIADAKVFVSDSLGLTDTLLHIGNGSYITQNLVTAIGMKYTLHIRLANGETYEASSKINRLCDFRRLYGVDTTRTIGPGGPVPAGGYVIMDAYDLPGTQLDADGYLFKYYVKRNDISYTNSSGVTFQNPYIKDVSDRQWKFYKAPSNITVAVDFNQVFNNSILPANTDAPTLFNLPLRVKPNTLESERTRPAYFPGDSIMIEIQSITLDNVSFYSRLETEATNGTGGGFSGLFATPSTNLPTNIINTTSGSSKKTVGWFGGAALARKKMRMINFDFKETSSN